MPQPVSLWGSTVILMFVAPGSILWSSRSDGHLDAPLFWVPVSFGLFMGGVVGGYTNWTQLTDAESDTSTRATLLAIALIPVAVGAIASLGPSVRHAMRFRLLGAAELFLLAILFEIWIALLLAGPATLPSYLLAALHAGSLSAIVYTLVRLVRSRERPEGLACLTWLAMCFLAGLATRVLVELESDPRVFAVTRSMIAVTALAAAHHPDAGDVGRLVVLDRGRSPVSAWRRTMLLILLINVLLAFQVSIGHQSRLAAAFVVVALGAVVLAEPLRGIGRALPFPPNAAVGLGENRAIVIGRTSDSLLHEELAAALIDDELDIHYQPIVDVESGCVVGAEALLRWDHPRGLTLTPPMILAVAASGSFGQELEQWIMGRALQDSLVLRQLIEAKTPESAGAFVSVNISTAQLEDPGFASMFLDMTETHGVDASTIVLELTEHDRLRDWPAASESMASLQAAGVSIALDDFGSGVSNVEILARLRFDVVKLDQTFSAGAISRERRALLESSVHAVRSLSVQLVLEGVELKDAAWSRALLPLVDLVQGYAYGAPMPLDEFSHFLEDEILP